MQMGMESCVGKTVMAGVMGGGLGAMFGLFMASVGFCFAFYFTPNNELLRADCQVDAI